MQFLRMPEAVGALVRLVGGGKSVRDPCCTACTAFAALRRRLAAGECCLQHRRHAHKPAASHGVPPHGVSKQNYCFWPDGELEYEHLAGGLRAALQADPQALDAARLARIDGPGVRLLLRWPRPLPLEEERARLLREVRPRCCCRCCCGWWCCCRCCCCC